MIADAWTFSSSHSDARLDRLRDSMRIAAAELAFEKAAAIRATIDRVESTRSRLENRHACDVMSTSWLAIQRAGPPRRDPAKALVRPYFISAQHILLGEPTTLAAVTSAADRWLSGCHAADRGTDSAAADWTQRSEMMWLLAKFLFQEERAPGLFYRADRLPEPPELAAAIASRFNRPTDDDSVVETDGGASTSNDPGDRS